MSQNLVKIYDGRNGFWQWDKGQRLVVLNDAVTNVHLSHKGEKSSRELEIKLENSMRICDIPDVFLQIPKNIVVYAVEQDYKEACTITSIEFAVKTRPQPDGYMSVHDNEYDDINTRISSLEDAVGLGRPIDAELSMVSIRPVQNKVITKKINSIDEAISIIVDWQNEVNESMSHTISVEPQRFSEEQKAQARSNIGAGTAITVDAELSTTSTNPVQNKVVTAKINELNSGLSTVSGQASGAGETANDALQRAIEAQGDSRAAHNILTLDVQPRLGTLETKVNEAGDTAYAAKSTLDYEIVPKLTELETAVDDLENTAPPAVTTDDNGKLLQVIDGKWDAADIEVGVSFTDDGEGNVVIEGGEGTGGGGSITVDAELSTTSTNPVQNKAIAQAIADLQPVRFTVTKQDNKYVASKTFQELLDILAENEHRSIICEFEGYDLPLVSVFGTYQITFAITTTIWDTIQVVFTSPAAGSESVDVFREGHSITINGQLWDEDDPNADFTDTINGMIDNKVSPIDITKEQNWDYLQRMGALKNLGFEKNRWGDIPIGVRSTAYNYIGRDTSKLDSYIEVECGNTGVHNNATDEDFSVLSFVGSNDELVKLNGIATGTSDYHAVNVKQLNAAIGDIESALDELHAYAQALVNGGASE